MKRTGIITFQKCYNFGADLQAYALGAKLRALGYDAENIKQRKLRTCGQKD